MSWRCSPQYTTCVEHLVRRRAARPSGPTPAAPTRAARRRPRDWRAGSNPAAPAEAVADQPQVPRRGDPRVLLPQRARGGVARVRERRLAGLDQRGVERLEVGQPEVDLAAHLDQLGNRELGAGGEPLGHLLERAHVERDVLARAPVAAGQRAGEQAVLVEQVHREPVDLQLAEVGHLADLARRPARPRPAARRREGVVQAEHALEVVVRGELGGELAADLLRGRVRRRQLRMASPPAPPARATARRTARPTRSARRARSSGTGGRPPRRPARACRSRASVSVLTPGRLTSGTDNLSRVNTPSVVARAARVREHPPEQRWCPRSEPRR